MKLVRKSGSMKCNPNYQASYWGCTNVQTYNENALMTIITSTKNESVLPPAQDLEAIGGCNRKRHFYRLNGTTHTSPELVFRDLPNPLPVSRNQEMQIWYGQDWIDCSEGGNSGTTCVDVYAWYV